MANHLSRGSAELNMRDGDNLYPEPFTGFEPSLWDGGDLLNTHENVYTTSRVHGVSGEIIYHNLTDEINQDLPFLDKILLEYQIASRGYALFSVRDIFEAPYSFSDHSNGNIAGELGERISRRIVKYFLKHLSAQGRTGGIFDRRFNPKRKNGYIVAHTGEYLLKILNYPNLVILQRQAQAGWDYTGIKELDGLFDYRINGQRHILVLETKLDKIQIDERKLITNLFRPLEELIPHAQFHYILFSSEAALYRKVRKYRLLKEKPVQIYKYLRQHGVSTLFMTFNESRSEFDRMAAHLSNQYRHIGYRKVDFTGRIVMHDGKLALYNNGEDPFLYLEKDANSGMWREIPFKLD
ncbi:MAG: hypothetical protein ACQEQV_05750 [Fibrobacterota bacterium]